MAFSLQTYMNILWKEGRMLLKKLFQPIFLSFIAAEYVAKLRGQFIDRDLR